MTHASPSTWGIPPIASEVALFRAAAPQRTSARSRFVELLRGVWDGTAVAACSGMDKTQDADLEKGYETIEEDDRALFETDDDLFESHASEENELDYEPEGAYLD